MGTGRDRGYGTALMTLHHGHDPEISQGHLTVTVSVVKTMGAPHWAIMPFSIVTGGAVVHSHERAAVLATESQTSSTFAPAANSGPGDLP